MDIGGFIAVVLAATSAVLLLAIVTTTARHRRMDARHAKQRELRRQAVVLDGRVFDPPPTAERAGRFMRDPMPVRERIRW
jgi:hypothetical protein